MRARVLGLWIPEQVNAMKSLILAVVMMGAGCASAPETGSSAPVSGAGIRPGLEVFLESPPTWVVGKRVGLITNHTGMDRQRRRNVDLLAARHDFELVTLFAFEHGLAGTAPPGQVITSGVDARTGLPVHSLYGDIHKPTPEMMDEVEVLIYDVQDGGARPLTRVSTMALAMQAAAEKGIPFAVLDRPNPIGGTRVEGNVLDPSFASFVGMYPIAMRHGMTVGELARMYNEDFEIGAHLTVIPVEGWQRDLYFDETGLPWVGISPNLRRLEALFLYPGTVLLEGTNLSEGRGTELPFEQTGAPWLDSERVASEMNAMALPGIRFEAVRFTVEAGARKFPGQTIPGVRFVVTDREQYRPVSTAVVLIDLIRHLHPTDFQWTGANRREPGMITLDRLAGTDRLRNSIEAGQLREFMDEWNLDEQRFRNRRARYLLYP
jgi:uncharacterized protein YbbC (DUF1343 family)